MIRLLIEMKNITKTYGDVVANKDVSINLMKNEILAIVGENGAGKSTIMKILYGLEQKDSGQIFVEGKPVNINNPVDAMKLGIGMVQQHFMFFEGMSVAENVVYNNELAKGIFFDYEKTNKSVKQIASEFGLNIDPQANIDDLAIGVQQQVEILKILYQQSDIIIFDEPSAVLTPIEVDELMKTMLKLKAMGKSIILITHKLSEVMRVSDRVVVMRQGELVYESKTSETDEETLTYNMVGRHIQKHQVEAVSVNSKVLVVKDLDYFSTGGRKALDHVNLEVRKGEIVGIAGVSGNGQSELVRVLSGLLESHGGKIFINDNETTNQSVHQIRKAGLSHVPEDRYYWGSALAGSLIDNILMGYEDSSEFSSRGILKTRKIEQFSRDKIAEFNVRVGPIDQQMRELSGGNAQKLIIAREFSKDTDLLVVNEPTRGVDIGAMEFIHEELFRKRKEHKAILLVSSDLNEIMTLSDRIYVMFEGKINAHFTRNSVDAKTLGMYMVKGSSEL